MRGEMDLSRGHGRLFIRMRVGIDDGNAHRLVSLRPLLTTALDLLLN